MNAIRIRRTLESETLYLPELKSLLGRTVEIVVQDATPGIRPGTGDWSAWEEAARHPDDFDFDAWREQRDHDLRHADDHLP